MSYNTVEANISFDADSIVAAVADEINAREVAQHVDLSSLASEIDLDDLASCLPDNDDVEELRRRVNVQSDDTQALRDRVCALEDGDSNNAHLRTLQEQVDQLSERLVALEQRVFEAGQALTGPLVETATPVTEVVYNERSFDGYYPG